MRLQVYLHSVMNNSKSRRTYPELMSYMSSGEAIARGSELRANHTGERIVARLSDEDE